MSAPKSVTKLKTKNKQVSVEFIDNHDETEYYMYELSRAALRDVGKYLKKMFNTEFDQHFQKRTGRFRKGTKYKVWSSQNTEYPRVDIGLKSAKDVGFWAYYQEFGTKDGKIPRLGIMQKVAKDNVATIVEIEKQYLSYLSDEPAKFKTKVNEAEEEG